ncbi:hypothetical protein C8Q73DRAFT_643391 [Cubamyces lactineus]|nr:hypothetical protein C8Q73DRAFT_643391 [Cubamyces lactineus]
MAALAAANRDAAVHIPSLRVLGGIEGHPQQVSNSADPGELYAVDFGRATLATEQSSVFLVHRGDIPALRSYLASSTEKPNNHPKQTYCISAAGACGFGVFSTTTITRGDLILRERPLLVYPQLLPYRSSKPPLEQYPELHDAVSCMRSEDREAFYQLANCHDTANVPSTKGIIDTNALHLGTLGSSNHPYGAVCRDISRINHSCTPNAVYHFDPQSFTFEVRALHLIPPNAQIFISYIDPALPRSARQDALASYGFTCACPACALTGPALAQSENRRSLIARADADLDARDAALERWLQRPSPSIPDEYVNRVDRMYMDLFEKERLYYEPVWEGFAIRLCKVCCALGDREGAQRWAELAVGLNRAYTGSDRGWAAVVEAPERTRWWGLRTSRTKDASPRLVMEANAEPSAS